MCKIKQLNGDPICTNNYGTKRDYEVLLYIKEHEEVKAGDILKGSEICTNPTKKLQWEVRECNRVDGGHVVIVDNKEGKVKTFMFVFGKGQKKTTTAKTEQQQATTQEEETTNNNETTIKTDETMNTTANNNAQANNNGIEQVANIFASLQNEAYNNGYKVAQEEAAAKIDNLTAQVEELKNRPTTSGTVINITIDGKKETKVIKSIVNPNAEELVDYLKNGENVFLWGPAGAGKNVLGEQLAEMLCVAFYYMNTVYTKYDITGFTDAQGNYIPTAVINWLKDPNGGLMFFDEMCTNSPEANTAINALLANKYIVLQNGEVLKMSPRHYVVAADNTNGLGATEEYNGRYKMDESTRDRFAFFFIDYDAAVEESIVGDKKDILDFVRELRKVTKECNISLVLGYRCINRLVKFYTRDAARTIEHNILKGMEQDTVNEIAARLTGSTKWHKAFKTLVK